MMIIEYTKQSQHKTIQWPGGTTTELAVYPKESSYTDRNFLFRISTATIETKESTFTKLPGVTRKLMILSGEIRMEHKKRYSKTLKKFQQDEFQGDWDTKSIGKATDFNLMLRQNTQGTIEAIILSQNNNIQITPDIGYFGIYVLSGKIHVQANKGIHTIKKGDFYSIYPENRKLEVSISIEGTVELIITKIKF